jgi:hypothetical protein
MYTLRLTRSLLAHVERHDATDVTAPPTTRLGDWYVAPFSSGGRELLMCTSERCGLSVVLPADRLDDLPTQLVVALVPVLRALGVPSDAIATEVEEMAEGEIGPTRSRSVPAAMRAVVREAQAVLAGADEGRVDVAGLHRRLAAHRSALSGAHACGLAAHGLLTIGRIQTSGVRGAKGSP